jgi:hypothetical protein
MHGESMQDERWVPGMPVLDRQPPRAATVPSRVPETRPTPLQEAFIPLSVVVLFCGIVVISALNLGAPLGAPIVRLPILIAVIPFMLVTTDALVRIWRSAWAWMPVDRGRGLFRLVWAGAVAICLAIALVAAALVLLAR